MDNPIGSGLRPENYLSYRQQRAAAGIHGNALNNELGYVNAVFNKNRESKSKNQSSLTLSTQFVQSLVIAIAADTNNLINKGNKQGDRL